MFHVKHRPYKHHPYDKINNMKEMDSNFYLNAKKDPHSLLARFVALLLEARGQKRLLGATDEETIWEEHIRDCLVPIPLLPESGRCLDVGSGGGLPGIIWAIALPGLFVDLLDSNRKKSEATAEIVSLLALGNVRALCDRAESYALKSRENYDIVACRAVGHVGVIAEYMAPFAHIGGRLLAFKGPKVRLELDEIKKDWSELGLSEPKIWEYPGSETHHCIVLWEKRTPLSSTYPRKVGLPEKRPWWR